MLHSSNGDIFKFSIVTNTFSKKLNKEIGIQNHEILFIIREKQCKHKIKRHGSQRELISNVVDNPAEHFFLILGALGEVTIIINE